MSMLIIDKTEREKIAELRAVAAASPFDAVRRQACADRDIGAFRDMMRMYGIVLPIGFHVVYTHEIQPNAPPPGLCHHISISIAAPFKMPHEEAVEIILKEFEMRPLANSDGVWIENVSVTHRAVNIVQLIDAG